MNENIKRNTSVLIIFSWARNNTIFTLSEKANLANYLKGAEPIRELNIESILYAGASRLVKEAGEKDITEKDEPDQFLIIHNDWVIYSWLAGE